MALKGDHEYFATEVGFFMNETGNRGCVVTISGGGSGAALDQALAVCTIPVNGSGVPLGILLNDVVNLDLTRYHLNFHKAEVQQGNKVCILRQGWVVTNSISGTPAVGNTAYFTGGGKVTPSNTGSYPVGRFMSSMDEDGYAKVVVNLPNGY